MTRGFLGWESLRSILRDTRSLPCWKMSARRASLFNNRSTFDSGSWAFEVASEVLVDPWWNSVCESFLRC